MAGELAAEAEARHLVLTHFYPAVLETDIEVIKKCEEDLKKVRDDDKVVEALIQKNFGSILSTLKDLVVKYSLTAGPRLLVGLMKDAGMKQIATAKFKEIEKLLEDGRENV
jgi:hypothetical protein